jgi:hypothetical protein
MAENKDKKKAKAELEAERHIMDAEKSGEELAAEKAEKLSKRAEVEEYMKREFTEEERKHLASSGDPNSTTVGSPRYVVTAFTDNQLFTVGFEQTPFGKPTIRTIGGSPNLVPAPVDPPPSNFAPPYTPSADGTAITGGTGSVVTDDGVWSFGAPMAGGGCRCSTAYRSMPAAMPATRFR